MKFIVGSVFLFSALFFPWWVSVPFGILVTLYPGGYVIALLGGVSMDTVFGAPLATLGGFAYLYTALFALSSVLVYILRDRVVD